MRGTPLWPQRHFCGTARAVDEGEGWQLFLGQWPPHLPPHSRMVEGCCHWEVRLGISDLAKGTLARQSRLHTSPSTHAVLWLSPCAQISLFYRRIVPGTNACQTDAVVFVGDTQKEVPYKSWELHQGRYTTGEVILTVLLISWQEFPGIC